MLPNRYETNPKSSTDLSIKLSTSQQKTSEYELAEENDQTLKCIWQSFKRAVFYQSPSSIYAERSKAVQLIFQAHRIMKLPIQTLYLSISVFDKILCIKYQLKEQNNLHELNINTLGLACLYSCQKLQKIRNYGISHWLKHLSHETLSLIGYPDVKISAQIIKKYEAFIMYTTDYNLFSTTVFDILNGLWTIKPPSERQFYFSQYLLQTSLFTQFKYTKFDNNNINTASSSHQNGQNTQYEDSQTNKIQSMEIGLSIINLCFHFFRTNTLEVDQLIKKLWPELALQQNGKQFQLKKMNIRSLSNSFFLKILNYDSDIYCKGIAAKYSRHVNLAISSMKFYRRNKRISQNKIEYIQESKQEQSSQIQRFKLSI